MLQAALWAIHVLAAAAHTGVSSPGATRWTGLDIREGLNFAAAEPEGDSNQTDGEAPADGNPGDSDDDHSDEPGEMDCADLVSFRVQITVLGKLGPLDGPEPSPEEKAQKKDKASKWLFSTLLRSMLHGKSEQYKLSTTAVPTIDVKTVEPFTKTENGQRSPLESTIINIDFPETDVCSAAAFGRDVCGDYDSADEELLNGFLRALDVSAQYPRQAIEAVSKAGLGPKSMIMLRAVSIDGPTSMSICNWGTRFSSASIQGALLLPDCPANSARCEDRPHLCSADEAQWRCKCTLGYEGELTIPGLEGDVKDFAGPFSVVGSCNAIEGYCQLGGRYALKLASGENAKGVLGETATPDCEEGFEAAGSSQCAEGHSKQGMWSPEPRCNYIPPTAPPEPFCSAPPQDGTLSLKGCSLCMGVEAGKSGPECNCEVTCAAGHEEVGTIKSGRKDCVASEFPCPAAVHMDDAGCVDTISQEPTMLFCCDASWGANLPPMTLESGSCRDITEDKQCLTSMQAASGADAAKAGQPCCWSRSLEGASCGVKQDPGTVCVRAVARRVITAAWSPLPSCVPPCDNTFDPGYLQTDGCDKCFPKSASTAAPCNCKVQCLADTVRIGGGPVGARTCEPKEDGDGFMFGRSPACWLRPLPLECPAVDAPGRKVVGCDCQAGEACVCQIECDDGFVRTSGGAEGKKQCHQKPLTLKVQDCESITDSAECLLSHASGHDAGVVPCCWREEGYENGKKCIASGSEVISQTSLPQSCAAVAFTEWDELPTCTPLCNMELIRGKHNLDVDACETCIAGQDCGCTVKCSQGFVRVGGGPEGPRSCTPDSLSLGAPPVCREPKAGEPGKYPVCPRPQVANAAVSCQCQAGADGCECPIFCKHTHGNIKASAPEGTKKCSIQEKVPAESSCAELTSESDCLSHSQDGEPCCFREEGLYAECEEGNCKAVAGSVCAPRHDSKMFFSPKSCAKFLFPEWEEMPDCQPLCVPRLAGVSNIVHENCIPSACIADQPCECTVKCADGFERVGGGPEGPRSCTSEALDFEEAPLCQATEATPQCDPVPSAEGLVVSDCAGCTAGEECKCKVKCANGYAIFTDVPEGAKTCQIDAEYALKPGTCASLTSQEECAHGSEDGVPCCWRGAGFRDAKCAAKGSAAIGLQTPPDFCAATQAARMDPLPVCKMLCVNQFAGAAYVNDDNCDRCFVGETCSCTVKCEVETVQQSGEKGDKRCGDVPEDPSSFGEPLVCVPRKPPQVPSCETLVDNTFATLITGCKNCKAGTSCRCDVTCREDHKHTGGGEQGAKKCLSEVYECPVRVVWNQRAKRCKDAATSLFVDTFCCPEALDEAVELDDSSACSALTGETECLKGEDQTSKQACCWRNSGFADGNKCAAHGSDAITDATRAHACANRPRILHAHFEELPVCTKKCHDPFQASWAEKLRGGVSLEASDCENCVPGEQDCPCKVVCAAGFIHVGGGREDHGAPRICDAVSKVFPLAPTCMPKPETPKCAVPNSYGQLVQGCKACTPGQPCSCSVSCDRGLDASSGTLGAKACVQRPAQLKPSTCTKLKTRESCLSGLQQQHGAAGQPCCYRKAGFDGLGTGTCAMQGSEEIQLKPDACAVMEVAVFEELPVCVPICMNKFPRIARSYKVEQCDHCLADTACDCKMTCQSGHYFVGGEPEGSRSCTFDNPYLASPPVCEPIEEVECLEPPEEQLQNMYLSHCRRCTTSGSCRCSAKCMAHHTLKPGSAPEGPKKCLAVDASRGTKKCSRIFDSAKCATYISGETPCCWQPSESRNGGECLSQGSPKIFKTSSSRPVCAQLQVGRYEEFPTCVPTCKHSFDRFLPQLAYNKQACGTCTPKTYPGQQACACKVLCAQWYVRVGGGPEGPRSCSRTSDFDAPPACMRKPVQPSCPRPDALGLKVYGCNCKAGQADCLCHVQCMDGYRMTEGAQGDMRCMEESAMEDLIVARCAEALSQTQCLISQEGGKPCCWRQEGFQTNYCAPEGSAEITASKVPEACARVTKGVFRLVQDGTVGQGSLPTCTPTCVNTFAQIPNVVHENCDNCRPDEECHCTVSCAPGLKPLGGNTGPRSCLLRSNRAEFEAAPECVRPCETPDHQRGTLDVSRCMQNCAPGDRECTCDVRCASGNFRVGGGHEGLKACEATSSGPRHRKLPICLPKCAAPDDQFGALNTNKCASCIAKTECNCELSCYTRASASGAKPGRKTCSFIVGTETSAAAAVWEPSDGVGPAGVPQCLPPMVIQVQDARTQLPLRGVTITVSVPYGNSDRLHELEKLYTDRSTAKDFSVEFSSEARDLFVKIEKPGYTSVTRKLDRGKNCKDAFNCRFQFSISESLKGGQLYADGCFLIGNPKTIKWDMRAVLEWEEKPGDLDIWARNYECYASVEKSYVCDGNRPHQYDSSYGIARRRTICKRTLFTQKQVRNKEYEVCGNSLCKEDKEHRTEFSRRRVVRPECPYVATNQYPKWVHWATRYAAELSKRWRREKMIEEDYVPSYRWKKKVWAKDAYEWTAEHHMVLDVDKRTGFGPETITFQSVPVGTYQVVVNQFSSTGAQVEDISAANPRVNIYIGGNSVRFECMISETCRRKARIWNVVNIEVEDAGEVPGSTKGERKYRISIKDSQSDMIPLRWVDLPTSDKTGRDLYNMDYYFPSKVTAVEYSDQQLTNVCYGQCEPADDEFQGCLARFGSPVRRLWENTTVEV